MKAPDQRNDQPQLPDLQCRCAEQCHADNDRRLLATQQLEAALGAGAPRREQAWLAAVRDAMPVLAAAAHEEASNASLLSDVARTQLWLRNRVRGLRIYYGQLRDGISGLDQYLAGHAGQTVDFTDIRQRVTWALAGLRH